MAEKPPIPFDCEGTSDAARPPLLREVADQLEEVYSDELDALKASHRTLAAAAADRYQRLATAHAAATMARTARDAAILEDRSVTDGASLAEGRIPMRKIMSTDLAEREFRAEIAVLLRISENAAAYLISDALLIASVHPEVCESLAAGSITDRHATLLVRSLSVLPEDRRAGVVATALPVAERLTPPQFKQRLRKIVDKALEEPLAVRHAAAVEEREVVVFPMDDGMGMLQYYDTIVNVMAIANRLDHMADTFLAMDHLPELEIDGSGIGPSSRSYPGGLLGNRPDAGPGNGAGAGSGADVSGAGGHSPTAESRTRRQIRADIFRDLMIDGEADVLPEELLGIRPEVSLLVPVETAMGGDEEGHLDGYGPIDADTARQLCAQAPEFFRILTHPDTGTPLSMGRETYRPPRALRRYLRRRDGTCRFPGCTRPAMSAEIDHTTGWADGGLTDHTNLACLCIGHHTLKTVSGWNVEHLDDGILEWTSPTGRKIRTYPEEVFGKAA